MSECHLTPTCKVLNNVSQLAWICLPAMCAQLSLTQHFGETYLARALADKASQTHGRKLASKLQSAQAIGAETLGTTDAAGTVFSWRPLWCLAESKSVFHAVQGRGLQPRKPIKMLLV